MAIRRTLKQKIKTQERRELLTYEFSPTEPVMPVKSSVPTQAKRVESDLFGYPVRLIYQDMIKTVVVAVLTIAGLVALTLSGRFS